jgi:RNA polymerase sigma-70 factor (ECF subfamily)
VKELEDELASLMRAAQAGDAGAYRHLLSALADMLRRWVRRELSRQGYEIAEAEDIVQETLLAIHLKRGSWDPDRAILPWLRAVTRHKLIDNLRRRGRRIMVPVDDIMETLAAPEPEETLSSESLDRHLATLPPGQSQVVRAISIDGLSPSETAKKLTLSEGAVRVALHRGLAALSRAAQRSEQ